MLIGFIPMDISSWAETKNNPQLVDYDKFQCFCVFIYIWNSELKLCSQGFFGCGGEGDWGKIASKMLSSQVSLRYNCFTMHVKISNTGLASSSYCPRPAAAPSPGTTEWGWRTLCQLQLCWLWTVVGGYGVLKDRNGCRHKALHWHSCITSSNWTSPEWCFAFLIVH